MNSFVSGFQLQSIDWRTFCQVYVMDLNFQYVFYVLSMQHTTSHQSPVTTALTAHKPFRSEIIHNRIA